MWIFYPGLLYFHPRWCLVALLVLVVCVFIWGLIVDRRDRKFVEQCKREHAAFAAQLAQRRPTYPSIHYYPAPLPPLRDEATGLLVRSPSLTRGVRPLPGLPGARSPQ